MVNSACGDPDFGWPLTLTAGKLAFPLFFFPFVTIELQLTLGRKAWSSYASPARPINSALDLSIRYIGCEFFDQFEQFKSSVRLVFDKVIKVLLV